MAKSFVLNELAEAVTHVVNARINATVTVLGRGAVMTFDELLGTIDGTKLARKIARKLAHSEVYQGRLMNIATYDDHDDEFLTASQTSCVATLTASEIAGYIEED